MNLSKRLAIGVERRDVIDEVREYRGLETRLVGVPDVTAAGVGGDGLVRGIIRSEELGAEQGQVGMGRKYGCLLMKMVDGSHLEGAGIYSQGRVLYGLQGGDGRVGGIREPYRGGICKDGFNQHLIDEQKDLFRLSPAHPGQGLENAGAGACAVSLSNDVGGEGEIGVESDFQNHW